MGKFYVDTKVLVPDIMDLISLDSTQKVSIHSQQSRLKLFDNY